jgi:hypothetical protein
MLASPAITELTTESAVRKLFNEWLAKWFDGQMHAINASTPALPFPKVNRAFGQGPAVQPLHQSDSDADAEIRLLVHSRAELASVNDTALYQGKLVTDFVLLHFWVSAKKAGAGQSELLAQTIAERLKALLSNPDARYELAPKGIGRLQPQGIQAVQSTDYARRLVPCNAQLSYAVQYGEQFVAGLEIPGESLGVVQTLNFQREAPLLAGTYLLGYCRWSVRVKVLSALVTAWPPQGQDVVLGLEVEGVLTGQTLTMPQGEANAEARVEVQFEDVYVAAGQSVRWKVVSAPDGELTAWQVNLSLAVQGVV